MVDSCVFYNWPRFAKTFVNYHESTVQYSMPIFRKDLKIKIKLERLLP